MSHSFTVKGGKSLYGASVAILMLDAKFPRIPGDMGNANTWPFPVHYKIVKGATPDKVVRCGAHGLLDNFIAAAREAVDQGADGITTNCGFLALFQQELADAVKVPVATSSLMQTQMVNALLPADRRPGILTISKASLTDAHLKASNVPPGTPIGGTDNGAEFTRVILDNEEELNIKLAREDLIRAGKALLDENPDMGALILECTNMVPYAADLREALGIPIFSIYTFITWFQAALMPRQFDRRLIDHRHF